jgi:hypothetical protein
MIRAMFFVYRSHYDGPLSKHVRRLPDTTVLGWFRRGWHQEDPEQWLEQELDNEVYGLSTIFEAVREHGLPAPDTPAALFALLQEHLWLEADSPACLRFDGRALRAETDDDEYELAYMFVDEAAVSAAPQRWAYPLHEHWPLPADVVERPAAFDPVGLAPHAAAPYAGGTGTTYAVLLICSDGDNSMIGPPPLAFPGVRVPDFAARLHDLPLERCADWPERLRLLHRAVHPDERSLTAALARVNRWWGTDTPAAHAGPLPDRPQTAPRRRDPDQTLIEVSDHIAQMALHEDEFTGFEQWFLFDDVWAGSHPELAESLMRYAWHWDPLHEPAHPVTGAEAADGLRKAVDRLYEVFAAYPLHDSTDPCPHCFTAADEQRLHARPLPELTADELREFATSALTTWGGVADLKHFLPRILELGAYDGFDFPDLEILYQKLDLAGYTTWPEQETAALRDFVRAHWLAALYGQAADSAETALEAIMLIEPDVASYLNIWEHLDDPVALEQLTEFVENNQQEIVARQRLKNAYLHDRGRTGQAQTIDWLIYGGLLRTQQHRFENDNTEARARVINALMTLRSRLQANAH